MEVGDRFGKQWMSVFRIERAHKDGLNDKLECLRELGETGLRGTLKTNSKGADRRT